jgi:hypothetical protein
LDYPGLIESGTGQIVRQRRALIAISVRRFDKIHTRFPRAGSGLFANIAALYLEVVVFQLKWPPRRVA